MASTVLSRQEVSEAAPRGISVQNGNAVAVERNIQPMNWPACVQFVESHLIVFISELAASFSIFCCGVFSPSGEPIVSPIRLCWEFFPSNSMERKLGFPNMEFLFPSLEVNIWLSSPTVHPEGSRQHIRIEHQVYRLWNLYFQFCGMNACWYRVQYICLDGLSSFSSISMNGFLDVLEIIEKLKKRSGIPCLYG